MKKIIIISIFSIIFSQFTKAEGLQDSIQKANAAYTEQQYELAIDLYKSVIEAGYESPELYYNLGNAFFKNNEIASAILYFEKAKKLNPTDERIAHNLEIANMRTMDRIEAVPEIFYIRWWKQLRQKFPADTWAKAGIAGLFLFFTLLWLYYFGRRISVKKTAFFSGLLVIIATVFLFIMSYSQYNFQVNSHEAIIFSPSVTAKSSPDENSTNLFVIHEGTKVIIEDKIEGWNEIRIADGSIGWIKAEDLEEI